MQIVVYHSGYGCDTGCCGHIIRFKDGSKSEFNFTHPYGNENHLDFAKRLVKLHFGEDHIKDLDWDNCKIIAD